MAKNLTVTARIIAQDDATPVVGRVRGAFASLGSFLASRFVITLGDVTRAFSLLASGLRFAVGEAAEAQRNLQRLDTALERFGVLSGKLRSQLVAQAEALAVTTRATDDQVIAMQTLLANMDVAPQDLKSMLEEEDLLLVNVHVPFEGDIEETDLSIAFDEVTENLDQLPQDVDSKIVLYCRSGNMSATAAETLVGLGYTNVWNLAGGMIAWEEAGYPLVRDGS